MRAYELMVLIDPEVDERTVEPTLKKYLEVVTNAGGTVDKIDVWVLPRRRRKHLCRRSPRAASARGHCRSSLPQAWAE